MAVQKVVGYDTTLPAVARANNLTAAKGFVTENFNLSQHSQTGAAATDGTIFLSSVGVSEGDIITKIYVCVETAGTGAGTTLAQAGLYDRLGNRIAASATGVNTIVESAGIVSFTLATAYTVPANVQAFYVGFINKNSTTVCNLVVNGAVDTTTLSPVTGKFATHATGGISQTSLGASITPATTNAVSFWTALG